MRRYISYLLLCGATLLGVGASVAPTVLNMDADMAYESGKTMYFKAAAWDETTQNGNYTDGEGEFLSYKDGASKQPIEYIAQTMRDRLDAYGLTGYKVETQGSDTVSVTVRARKDSETIYGYLEKYLSFSGGDYELDASIVTGTDYAYNEHWADIIDGQTAYIVDMEQGAYNVPTVVVPLKEGSDYKDAFDNLVKYCKDNTTEADEEAGTEGSSCMIVVWSNRDENDTYEIAGSDPNISAKIVSMVSPSNGVYYESSDSEQEKPFLRLIPTSSATSGESYDPSKTVEAYDAARTLMLTINAGKFQYDELKDNSGSEAPQYAVSFTYSENTPASVENLLKSGDWNRTVALSSTLISIGVAIIFVAVMLAFFQRILAPLQLATMAITAFASFAVYVAFGTPFNIAALIGLVATAFIGLFGSLFYGAKLKEEIYKGRTLKKAHAEAVKRSLLPTLDLSVISVLIGVCLYGLGGDVASKAGVMLVLGGFFGFIANTLYTRIGGWLLCNDSTMASKFGKQLGIREDRIPDLVKEEKPSYFGPYANSNFSKGKKISLIATCAFLLAGIGASIGWGIASNGSSFFNSSAYESAAPILRLDVRSNQSNVISVTSYSETSRLLDANFDAEDPQDLFHIYKINDAYLADYVSDDIQLSSSAKSVYTGQGDEGQTYYWFYYQVTLGKKSSVFTKALTEDATIKVERWNGSSYVNVGEAMSLSDFSSELINTTLGEAVTATDYGAYSNDLYVTFSAVKHADLTPYLWQVTLGMGIGLASVLVYMMLRYRPSRGIVAGLIIAASSFIGTSFFILTRISTSPVVSLGSILAAVLVAAMAIYVLAAEKEIYRDSKEKDKNTPEFRAQCLQDATSRQAHNVFLFVALALYVAISCFGFGPRIYANSYLSMLIAIAFGLSLVLTAMASSSALLGKQFAKIQFSRGPSKKKKKAKQGGQLMKKKNSAEPEESIFIGIND